MGVVTAKELKNRYWEETMRWVRGRVFKFTLTPHIPLDNHRSL